MAYYENYAQRLAALKEELEAEIASLSGGSSGLNPVSVTGNYTASSGDMVVVSLPEAPEEGWGVIITAPPAVLNATFSVKLQASALSNRAVAVSVSPETFNNGNPNDLSHATIFTVGTGATFVYDGAHWQITSIATHGGALDISARIWQVFNDGNSGVLATGGPLGLQLVAGLPVIDLDGLIPSYGSIMVSSGEDPPRPYWIPPPADPAMDHILAASPAGGGQNVYWQPDTSVWVYANNYHPGTLVLGPDNLPYICVATSSPSVTVPASDATSWLRILTA